MPTERELREIAKAIGEIKEIVVSYADDDLRVLDRMLDNAFDEALLQALIKRKL